MSKESLGLLIRKLRKEKGLSYRLLAKNMKALNEDTAISYVNIVHIENGKIETKREVVILLAEALDYSVDALLAESEQVVNDVAEVIKAKPDVVPDFLRSAKNLSENDWKELSKIVKKMNNKND
jgi:transcriptional regulator with XRE-family HTH domain